MKERFSRHDYAEFRDYLAKALPPGIDDDHLPPPRIATLMITTRADRGGSYNAKIGVLNEDAFDPTHQVGSTEECFNLADYYDFPDADDAYVLNRWEDRHIGNKHALPEDVDLIVEGFFWKDSQGEGTDSHTSRPIYTVYIPASKFFARINGAGSQDGSNKRWKYAWVEVEKTATGLGSGKWTDVSGGRSGTTTTDPAYNLNETLNTTSGTYGNGVAEANLLGTMDVVMIPDTTIVEITEVMLTDGTIEYWITGYTSGIDGSCS